MAYSAGGTLPCSHLLTRWSRRIGAFPFRSSILTLFALALSPSLVPYSWGEAAGAPASATSAVCADSLRSRDRRRALDMDLPLLPAEATGDISFGLDASLFLDDEGRVTVEACLWIPHNDLKWIRAGQTYRGDVSIHMTIHGRGGRRSRVIEEQRAVFADSFDSTRRLDARAAQVIVGSVDFVPQSLEVTVEDLRTQKRTLVGMIKGQKKSGRCHALLPSWTRPADGPYLSTVLFASDALPGAEHESESPGSVSRHGTLVLKPNPSRFFGMRQEIFPVYFEVYRGGSPDDSTATAAPMRLKYRVTTTQGDDLVSAVDTIDVKTHRWGRIQRFSVAGYLSWTYVLAIELMDDADQLLSATYGDFHVIRSQATVLRDEQTILDDARVLLPPHEFEEFEAMQMGEREAYLEGFWQRLDPDPATPGNSRRDEFKRRVARAERDFGGGVGQGKLGHRGRILIRYGEPDEITRVRIASSHRFREVLLDELSGSLIVDWSEPRFTKFIDRQFRDDTDFEIWYFNGSGDPMLPIFAESPRGMVFIFVDEYGVGMYRLGYTTIGGIM